MILSMRKRLAIVLLLAGVGLGGCAPPDGGREDRLVEAYLRLTAAEDARPSSGRALTTLLEGSKSGMVLLRQAAVRGLGRLEDPDLVSEIEQLLADRVPAVRAEAANALAQAVHRSDRESVLPALLGRAEVEQDSIVLAALARSIGRSASTPSGRARASAALVRMSYAGDADAALTTRLGVALGFESLVRGSQGQGLDGTAAARLAEWAFYQGGAYTLEASRLRTLAFNVLGQARRLDLAMLSRVHLDQSDGPKVVAARFMGSVSPAQRPELLRRLMSTGTSRSPLSAIQQIAREPRNDLYCQFLVASVPPAAPLGVRVLAFDALGQPCPGADAREALIAGAASVRDAPADEWHVPAHALVSLARIAPEQAEEVLPLFAAHPNPFARTYAARAAAVLGAGQTLRSLADDEVANVRTAALPGLFGIEGHDIDDLLLRQLDDDDPQLLMTVAQLLEGSPSGVTAAAELLSAFERISAAERETWRDSRRALLERIAELGDPSLEARLVGYLSDYDAIVAEDVSAILAQWSGRARPATPAPLEDRPLPTRAELAGMVGARIVLHMRGSGSITITLLPFEATTNVFRFVRLAESGYFDGLTFHRWAPSFVIQGGSPGANEYQGDGPYTRDEVGLIPHWRGTVGISTRGRDTGDAQIFVNLEDNVRLNHDYTIVGSVVDGMDVVDAVLEGAVIERAEVIRAGG